VGGLTSLPLKGHSANFAHNRLPWHRPWKTRSASIKSRKYLSFGEKIVKIGPVDPVIIWLKLKKEEINEGKIYSPVSKFAERAKQTWRSFVYNNV